MDGEPLQRAVLDPGHEIAEHVKIARIVHVTVQVAEFVQDGESASVFQFSAAGDRVVAEFLPFTVYVAAQIDAVTPQELSGRKIHQRPCGLRLRDQFAASSYLIVPRKHEPRRFTRPGGDLQFITAVDWLQKMHGQPVHDHGDAHVADCFQGRGIRTHLSVSADVQKTHDGTRRHAVVQIDVVDVSGMMYGIQNGTSFQRGSEIIIYKKSFPRTR